MDSLPGELILYILEFCGKHNYINRLVCNQWKRIIPEVPIEDYLDEVCRYSYKITPSVRLANLAVNKNKVHILEYCDKNNIRPSVCVMGRAAKRGNVVVMEWAKNKNYHCTEDMCRAAIKKHQEGSLRWIVENYPILSDYIWSVSLTRRYIPGLRLTYDDWRDVIPLWIRYLSLGDLLMLKFLYWWKEWVIIDYHNSIFFTLPDIQRNRDKVLKWLYDCGL